MSDRRIKNSVRLSIKIRNQHIVEQTQLISFNKWLSTKQVLPVSEPQQHEQPEPQQLELVEDIDLATSQWIK